MKLMARRLGIATQLLQSNEAVKLDINQFAVFKIKTNRGPWDIQ